MEPSHETRFAMAENWRGRIVALLRVLAFVATSAGLMFLVANLLANNFDLNEASDPGLAVVDWLFFACLLAVIALLAWAAKRCVDDYGLGRERLWFFFASGAVAGLVLLALQLAALSALGVFSFGDVHAAGLPLLGYAALYLSMFLGVALFEETLFRGFLLVELSRLMSFWPAALVLSGLFGAVHLLNGDSESVYGAATAGLFGLILAWSFRLTGSLWLAIGIHFGWNFGQSFVFGVSNSGLAIANPLLKPLWHGPDWLTGGSVGPEGSLTVLGPLAAFAALAWLLRRRAPMP